MHNPSPQQTGRLGRLAARFDEYREWARLAQEQTGKGWTTQLREIEALRHMGGQCGISDYYWYKLYDPSYQEGRGAPDFLGWRLQGNLSLALNPRNGVLPAWDKTVFMLMANAAGLPVAPVLACFHPSTRISESLGSHLKTTAEVANFLRNPALYPLFGKPVYSQQGYGSASLASYNPTTDRLGYLDGGGISIADFVQRLTTSVDHRYHRPECGYLFQKSFTLDPQLEAFTKWPAICGVRIICLNGPDGVTPIRAIWKVATPPNHVDNFSLGKNGNLLANVNLTTGEIGKLIGGFWPRTQVLDESPTSGQSARGLKLPGWSKIIDACHRAGPAFPLMKIHHWDFALTDQGPLILELNDLGGTEIAQVHGCGLLSLQTRAFLKQHAKASAHPWVNAL
jgi:hypothetical protein